MKNYHDCINQFPNEEFHITDTRFKSIISTSLPLSWVNFVQPYNGNAQDPNDPDPKQCMTSDAFIGLLWEEYKIHLERLNNRTINGTNGLTMMATPVGISFITIRVSIFPGITIYVYIT